MPRQSLSSGVPIRIETRELEESGASGWPEAEARPGGDSTASGITCTEALRRLGVGQVWSRGGRRGAQGLMGPSGSCQCQ